MASKAIRGITIEIGGDTTKLGKALESSEKSSRSLQNELREVEKLLQFDPSNTELLAQKQDILTSAVKETSDKLDILREAERQVVEQFERGDIGVEQLRAFQREITKTENDLDGLNGKLVKTEDNVEDVGKSAEESGEGFTIMKGALADLTANAIQNAISAIGDFIGSLFELSEATEEYRQMQSKLAGSAGTFGYSVEFANEKYKEFYKYLGDDQMSTNAITNLMGLGTSTENVSALAEAAVGVWSAYGDSIPIEGLTEAMNETAQVGKVTGSLADALNWAGISEDEFNEKLANCTSTQERADLIADTLNGTYGESKKTYDEMSASILDANEAELDLKETQAELGETMAPVNTALTNLKSQALEAITPLVKACANGFMALHDWLQKNPVVAQILTAVVIALAAAFGTLAIALGIKPLILNVTTAFSKLSAVLAANPIGAIVALIAALVAAFVYLWNNCDAFRQFWIDLWENIKTIFSSVVEWFSTTIPKIGEFFVNLWNGIVNVFSIVGEWFNTYVIQPIVNAFTTAISWVNQNIIQPIAQFYDKWIVPIVNKIVEIVAKLVEMVVALFVGLWNLLNQKVLTPIANGFKKLWSTVAGFFKNLWSDIKQIWSAVSGWFNKNIISPVSNAFKSLWSGISNAAKSAWSAIKNVFGAVGSWFSDTFSKAWSAVKNVFSSWGTFFSGLWDKIKNTFSKIGTNIGDAIGKSVKAGINGIISAIENIINSGISLINGAINLINKLPGVSVGKIGKLNLPRLAQGGIVDSPTVAEIGEDGREAIIPLERNTAWLDVVAQKLNDRLTHNNGATDALLDKLDGIYERLGRLQMVLDTGVLVGELLDGIDAGLADRQLLNARGV